MAIKGVQKQRDFVAGRQVVNVCDHDIIRNYFFHWLNVGSGESRRDKGAVVPMSSWNSCDRAQAIFLVIILLFSLLISTTVKPPLTWYNSHLSTTATIFGRQSILWLPGFYLGFIVWRKRSPEWPKEMSFPGGPAGMPPQKLFEMNMRWDAIWCILRLNFAKCYSVCTNLIMSGWFFRYSYLYTVMRTVFFGGKAGHFRGGGEASTPQRP